MDIKIITKKENLLLKRKEVNFKIEQGSQMKTPLRLEVKKALAIELKVSDDLVLVKKMRTLTGTHITVGFANVYESVEQAKCIEPKYILKRNSPPEKPKEEAT